MIIQILFKVLTSLILGVASILPDATKLPYGIDAILVSGVGYFHYISAFFPPLTSIMNAVIFVITFKVGVKTLSMIPVIRHWFARV